jgi:hypothetical protein
VKLPFSPRWWKVFIVIINLNAATNQLRRLNRLRNATMKFLHIKENKETLLLWIFIISGRRTPFSIVIVAREPGKNMSREISSSRWEACRVGSVYPEAAPNRIFPSRRSKSHGILLIRTAKGFRRLR